jgi:hypothetical protein
MNKLQMDPPLGGGASPRLSVRAQRMARPPKFWSWAIHEEGRAEPFRRPTRLYRSAEDAWTVGHAVLERLPKPASKGESTANARAAPPFRVEQHR